MCMAPWTAASAHPWTEALLVIDTSALIARGPADISRAWAAELAHPAWARQVPLAAHTCQWLQCVVIISASCASRMMDDDEMTAYQLRLLIHATRMPT